MNQSVNGEVSSFIYTADSTEPHLGCPSLRPSQEKITETSDRLDVYRDLEFEDEKVRLDNLAIP